MNYSTCLIKTTSTLLRTSVGLVLSLCASLFAADFGVANWGMTKEQVKQIETRANLTPFGQENYLIYAVTLPGIVKTRLVYQFSNNQLIEGRFIFSTGDALDIPSFLNQYQIVKNLISKQYGPPNFDLILTSSEINNTPSPTEFANELASDRLILKTHWRSPAAIILHQLAWNIDKPHHQLHYRPSAPVESSLNTDAF